VFDLPELAHPPISRGGFHRPQRRLRWQPDRPWLCSAQSGCAEGCQEKHINDYEEFKLLFTRIGTLGNPGGGNVLDGPALQGGRAPQAVIVLAECDLVTAMRQEHASRPDCFAGNYL